MKKRIPIFVIIICIMIGNYKIVSASESAEIINEQGILIKRLSRY